MLEFILTAIILVSITTYVLGSSYIIPALVGALLLNLLSHSLALLLFILLVIVMLFTPIVHAVFTNNNSYY